MLNALCSQLGLLDHPSVREISTRMCAGDTKSLFPWESNLPKFSKFGRVSNDRLRVGLINFPHLEVVLALQNSPGELCEHVSGANKSGH
jgi:hypothetical protein